jgi:hypothetical protein
MMVTQKASETLAYNSNLMLLIVRKLKTKLNSVVLVRKRTIPTELPQPVGEVSANFS